MQSSSAEKNKLKLLKIAISGPNLPQKGVSIGHALKEKQFFFAEITKEDHKHSKTYYLIKISYVLAEL